MKKCMQMMYKCCEHKENRSPAKEENKQENEESKEPHIKKKREHRISNKTKFEEGKYTAIDLRPKQASLIEKSHENPQTGDIIGEITANQIAISP